MSAAEKDPAVLPPETAKDGTPLMKQYDELKSRHPNEILLFRLGDFYEIFGEDARRAAPVLEVILTQRQGMPMCGVPHHAMSRYVAKLLKRNFRVAVAEQMEDPAAAKGIVKRQITRVISPGTVTEETLLSETSNNFLCALALNETPGSKPQTILAGLAALDLSTGELWVTEVSDEPGLPNLASELSRFGPSEVLVPPTGDRLGFLNGAAVHITEHKLDDDLQAQAWPERWGAQPAALLASHPAAAEAARRMLSYVAAMNPDALSEVTPPRWSDSGQAMALDRETLENFEIVKNSSDGTSEKTLLSCLDRTLSPMGGRLFKQWLVRPLKNLKAIRRRLDCVEFLLGDPKARGRLRQCLKGASDLERIVVRLATRQASPRDLIGLKNSLVRSAEIQAILAANRGETVFSGELPQGLSELAGRIADLRGLAGQIQSALADDPPQFLEERGVIRAGYDPELEQVRKAATEGKSWLQDLEARQKQATGITNLKVGYTSVFGYYFEVTKMHQPKVPSAWHRKQTLVNAERYINEELKDLERKILGSEEECLRIEKRLFLAVLESVKAKAPEIQATAKALAELDCLASLAEAAETHGFCRPELDESEALLIQDGWHPVVKTAIPSGSFVPNDCAFERGGCRIMILTGPNMSGKSTYLRQTGLIVLMAQIGSYVPAKSARIGIVDRIFTRIGSGDRLADGASTFMVEMQETARILQHAGARSLVILDEVGRGTSTYDGISIACAVIEHLARLGPKVMFATHYFELTHLAGELEGVRNFNVQAKEWQDSVIFLHKIAPGPADRSYGIHVAKLAGLPAPVVERAKKILARLESDHQSLLQSRKFVQSELFKMEPS